MRLILLAWAITFQINLNAQEYHVELPVIKNIPEILVKPSLGVMRISRDTIEFKIGNTLDPEVVKLEDLFKNFLGFNITDNGRIFYNGKEVSFLLIDGDLISVSDYSIISKHLNANMFSSIELIQHYNANRFKGISPSKNEIAINIKMKKEFQNRFNTDVAVKTAWPKGVYGKTELNRMSGHIKSIAVIEKNINGDRWPIINSILTDRQDFKVPLISLIQHPFLLQSNLFKQHHLYNNSGHRIQMLHALKFASNTQLRLETGRELLDLHIRENQEIKFQLGVNNLLYEKRSSILNTLSENRYLKLVIDHDHFKNNRGEYKVFFIQQKMKQQLQDSITNTLKILNNSRDEQNRNTIVLQGEEKYFIKNKYLLETGFQAASNNLTRLMQQNFTKINELSASQKYISTNVGITLQENKKSFRIGHRFVLEERESSSQFRKQYVFVEHQYRMNKKIFLNHDLSLGKGEIATPQNRIVKNIYQLEGEAVYKKSLFNEKYIRCFVSQRIPINETWMVNPLLQLSGNLQYHLLPDRFSFIKKIELGRSYQHLYRGFGFNYSIVYSNVKNDIFHSIDIQSFIIIDTIGYRGNTSNVQWRAEADQFIFPVKMRISTFLQFSNTRMYQRIMGKLYPMILNQPFLRVTCKSAWEKSFHWEYSMSVQRSQSNTGIRKNNVVFFNHQLNSKFTLGRKLYTAFQSMFIQTQPKTHYMFLDILVQLKPSNKTSINFAFLNATNIQRFEQIFISNYGVHSISTPLPGRKLQIEFRRSF